MRRELESVLRRWLIGTAAILTIAGLPGAVASEASDLQAAEEAVKTAAAEEATHNSEWNSREMARSATREISRSERRRAEGALRNLLAAQEAVEQEVAAAEAARQAADAQQDADAKPALLEAADKADAAVAAAQKRLEQTIATMRAVTVRLVEDSRDADQAARELLVSEATMREKMAATRAAEHAVLELKAKAVDKAHAEATRRALEELAAAKVALTDDTAASEVAQRAVLALRANVTEKAKAEAAWRAVREAEALAAWESQLWDRVHKYTANEIVEQTAHAAKIATNIAAAETEPDRKKSLELFAQEETEIKVAGDKLMAEKDVEIEAAVAKIYPLRAAAIGGLKPLSPDAWDYAKARHLLVRAGFGGTQQEVEKLCSMGLYKAVDYLVDFHRQPPADALLDAAPPLAADPLEGKLRNGFVRGRAAAVRNRSVTGDQFGRLRQWWLKRLVESPRPLQEKLTLFWHGHFATQQSVVNNSYTMYHQNQLFREHAAGNFGGLLYGIVHDPVMIRYLDNNQNVKGHPNENLAREIMELFAMGEDQGYTEADIREAARALTGYTYDNNTGQFRVAHDKHDAGEKTIFGKKGNWTGDDLVKLILEQPSTARFVGAKLFEYFAYRDPDTETVDCLASVLRANGYELAPMLKNLFLSEEFYGPRATGTQIKSPVQLVVAMLRDLGVKKLTSYGELDGMVQGMGQSLFEPPDVKGWRYGRSWISANRSLVRYNSAAKLVQTAPQPGGSGVDLVGLLEGNGCKTAADVVDCLAKTCLIKPLNDQQRAKLIEFVGELPPQPEWAGQRDAMNGRLRVLLVLMISTPEYQMT